MPNVTEDTGGGLVTGVTAQPGADDRGFIDANSIRLAAGLNELNYDEYLSMVGGEEVGGEAGVGGQTGGVGDVGSVGDMGGGAPTSPAPAATPVTPMQGGVIPQGQTTLTGTGALEQDILSGGLMGNGALVSAGSIGALTGLPVGNDIAGGALGAVNNAQIGATNQVDPGTVEMLDAASQQLTTQLQQAGLITVLPSTAMTPQLQAQAGQAFDRAMQIAINQFEGMGRHDAAVLAASEIDALRQQYVNSITPLQITGGAIMASTSPFSFIRTELSNLFALETIARTGGSASRGIVEQGQGQGQWTGTGEEDFLGAGRIIGAGVGG